MDRQRSPGPAVTILAERRLENSPNDLSRIQFFQALEESRAGIGTIGDDQVERSPVAWAAESPLARRSPADRSGGGPTRPDTAGWVLDCEPSGWPDRRQSAPWRWHWGTARRGHEASVAQWQDSAGASGLIGCNGVVQGFDERLVVAIGPSDDLQVSDLHPSRQS